MAILHAETTGDRSELRESESFVQMTCMGVAFDNGIELENMESYLFAFLQAIEDQFFSDVFAS